MSIIAHDCDSNSLAFQGWVAMNGLGKAIRLEPLSDSLTSWKADFPKLSIFKRRPYMALKGCAIAIRTRTVKTTPFNPEWLLVDPKKVLTNRKTDPTSLSGVST